MVTNHDCEEGERCTVGTDSVVRTASTVGYVVLALSVKTVWKALRQIFDLALSTVVLQCEHCR